MSNLILSRKQYIDDSYIKWHQVCQKAVEDFIGDPTSTLVNKIVKVTKCNDFYDVKIVNRNNTEEDGLYFQLPVNFDFNLHYTILVSWLAQKLVLWQRHK